MQEHLAFGERGETGALDEQIAAPEKLRAIAVVQPAELDQPALLERPHAIDAERRHVGVGTLARSVGHSQNHPGGERPQGGR